MAHTLEEAYELADAAHSADDRRLLDELGDVLFQVHFLALLLEERGQGDLAAVAEHCATKLIRRHPHVFEAAEVDGAEDVLRRWEEINRAEPAREPGVFGEVPENLPALLLARKLQRRVAASGFDFEGVDAPLAALSEEVDELAAAAALEEAPPSAGGVRAGETARPQSFHELGDVLFAAVNVARKLRLDPELALRASSERFRSRVEAAQALAARAGERWEDLSADRQLHHYARVRLHEEQTPPQEAPGP